MCHARHDVLAHIGQDLLDALRLLRRMVGQAWPAQLGGGSGEASMGPQRRNNSSWRRLLFRCECSPRVRLLLTPICQLETQSRHRVSVQPPSPQVARLHLAAHGHLLNARLVVSDEVHHGVAHLAPL